MIYAASLPRPFKITLRGVFLTLFAEVTTPQEMNNVSKAFEMFPLAFAVSVADMEASYFIEGSKEQ